MKLFIFAIFAALINLAHLLPVKESSSTSTEKDPNTHTEEDSPQHNLENVIGKFRSSSSDLSSSIFHLFLIVFQLLRV